jgi:ribosomal protein L35AE/L33A
MNWLYTSLSTMLIKEYETPEEAKTFKFMKLVFSHTKEGEDVLKKRVCDTHGTHESTMQTLHFVLY